MVRLCGYYEFATGYLALRVNHKDEYVVHFISFYALDSAAEEDGNFEMALKVAEGADGSYFKDERAGIIGFSARIFMMAGLV